MKINLVLFNPFRSAFVGKSSMAQEYLLELLNKCGAETVALKKSQFRQRVSSVRHQKVHRGPS
ncbi:MAG: hypothetical protein KJ720_07970 [Proteobacteria bacterium]|nr:hypothetical protein [Pseudomonadota bacterium]MBU2469655.1 hypothetical protein [Pseudomonadota bacterium]MBU2518644.1 hypothetical protein [Pseudomonadota bacterium]